MYVLLRIILFMLVPSGNMSIDLVSTIENLMSCVTTIEVCPNENITFWLYTRGTVKHPYQLNMDKPDDIPKAPYIKGVPYKVIIHGFTENKDETPNKEVRPALFEHGEYNVISVDYGPLAKWPCYASAVENLKVVANCTAQLIDYIVQNMQVSLESFHFIGFSLGAHVAGQIPNYLKSGRVAHITGLDPAMPLFVTADLRSKLDASDANFVDVIHTSVAVGRLAPSGHVDFYVNGGNFQPGCVNFNRSYMSCNHFRSTVYYAESINSKLGFHGQNVGCLIMYESHCDTELMGFHIAKTAHGVYIVDTNDEPPYAKGTKVKSL